MTPQQQQHVLAKVGLLCQERLTTGCWVYIGKLDRYGYAVSILNGAQSGLHRHVWMALRGDIPDGLVVDHLCRVRHCVNPWHMDLVTSAVNTARGMRENVCTKGHGVEFQRQRQNATDGHTRRVCLICERAVAALRREKRRAAA